MSASSAAAAGRRAAEARMLSMAAVMRKTGAMVTDPDGFKIPEWATVHAAVPFRLGGSKGFSGSFRTVLVGGVEVAVAIRVGHFPAGTLGLVDGDLIDLYEGENAGVVLQIVEGLWQDQATALRVPVVEAHRPEEWA